MSAQKILLDSNAYFRLADSLPPLLSPTFGKPPGFKLFILGGTLREYNFQPRLRSKFDWVDKFDHIQDRKKGVLRLTEIEKTSISNSFKFMREAVNDMGLSCSPFDIECLATAFELKLQLVTDDLDLVILSKEYSHIVMSSLELMKFMLDERHISIEQIRGTTVMWEYLSDLPSQFESEYYRLFGEQPDYL